MFNSKKIRFLWSDLSKIKCEHCGYKFEDDDSIKRLSLGNDVKYIHEFCLDDMDNKEALELFGVDVKDVAV